MHETIDDAVEIIDEALADLEACGCEPLDRAAALVSAGLAELADADDLAGASRSTGRSSSTPSARSAVYRPGPMARPGRCTDMAGRHLRHALDALVEQRPANAKVRRGLRRRRRRVSGAWDRPKNASEHQLPPDSGPAPEPPAPEGERL
jgi:hypothetical protein